MAELIDNTARSRFEMTFDGHLAYLDYARGETRLDLLYIEVPRPAQGRGLAAVLLRAVLEHARQQHLLVRPICSYVDLFLRRHPEYTDLLEGA